MYLKFFFQLITVIIILILSNFNVNAQAPELSLPPLKAHPLPKSLQNWQFQEKSGDYFDKIETHKIGYFVFSQFPLKIYLDKPNTNIDTTNFSEIRFQQWVKAVRKAIADWNEYLPLKEIKTEEEADIIIKRQHPPIDAQINPETGLYDLPKAKSAQTRYRFYLSEDQPPLLLHRMMIDISPDQVSDYILAATRHELGHALGIWAHSNQKSDIMYFSQVRNPPPISPRDINTLQKIYQQPTRLGWRLN